MLLPQPMQFVLPVPECQQVCSPACMVSLPCITFDMLPLTPFLPVSLTCLPAAHEVPPLISTTGYQAQEGALIEALAYRDSGFMSLRSKLLVRLQVGSKGGGRTRCRRSC